MINCDSCADWFHGACVGITKKLGKEMEDRGEVWRCPDCKGFLDRNNKSSRDSEHKPAESPTLDSNHKHTESASRSTGRRPPQTAIRKSKFKTPPSRRKLARSIKPKPCSPDSSQITPSKVRKVPLYNESPDERKVTSSTDNVPAVKKSNLPVDIKDETRFSTSKCLVGCNRLARLGSLYCGTDCIVKYCTESIRIRQHAKLAEMLPLDDVHVTVFESTTGHVLSGTAAPCEEDLKDWLKLHPMYRVADSEFEYEDKTTAHYQNKSTESKKKLSDATRKPGDIDRNDENEGKGSNQDGGKIRESVRKGLVDALYDRCKEADDVKVSHRHIERIAADIEHYLVKVFNRDTGSKYRTRYRSLIFNIKDPKNMGLFRKIIKEEISPSKLARMTSEELASKELAMWRERQFSHSLEMIRREQEECQMSGTLTKKTHKGEVEIEKDAELSSVVDISEKLVFQKDGSSDPTPDTSDQHSSHLFDLHCKICTDFVMSDTANESVSKESSETTGDLVSGSNDIESSKDRSERESPSSDRKDRSRNKTVSEKDKYSKDSSKGKASTEKEDKYSKDNSKRKSSTEKENNYSKDSSKRKTSTEKEDNYSRDSSKRKTSTEKEDNYSKDSSKRKTSAEKEEKYSKDNSKRKFSSEKEDKYSKDSSKRKSSTEKDKYSKDSSKRKSSTEKEDKYSKDSSKRKSSTDKEDRHRKDKSSKSSNKEDKSSTDRMDSSSKSPTRNDSFRNERKNSSSSSHESSKDRSYSNRKESSSSKRKESSDKYYSSDRKDTHSSSKSINREDRSSIDRKDSSSKSTNKEDSSSNDRKDSNYSKSSNKEYKSISDKNDGSFKSINSEENFRMEVNDGGSKSSDKEDRSGNSSSEQNDMNGQENTTYISLSDKYDRFKDTDYNNSTDKILLEKEDTSKEFDYESFFIGEMSEDKRFSENPILGDKEGFSSVDKISPKDSCFDTSVTMSYSAETKFSLDNLVVYSESKVRDSLSEDRTNGNIQLNYSKITEKKELAPTSESKIEENREDKIFKTVSDEARNSGTESIRTPDCKLPSTELLFKPEHKNVKVAFKDHSKHESRKSLSTKRSSSKHSRDPRNATKIHDKKSTNKSTSESPSSLGDVNSPLWNGTILMKDVAKVRASAFGVSGSTRYLKKEFPETIQVCGRIGVEIVGDYITKIKQSVNKDVMVVRFEPRKEDSSYSSFFSYLQTRQRLGVAATASNLIKDFYILPLTAESPIPEFLLPFNGPGLPVARSNCFIGIIICHKDKKRLALEQDLLSPARKSRKVSSSLSKSSSRTKPTSPAVEDCSPLPTKLSTAGVIPSFIQNTMCPELSGDIIPSPQISNVPGAVIPTLQNPTSINPGDVILAPKPNVYYPPVYLSLDDYIPLSDDLPRSFTPPAVPPNSPEDPFLKPDKALSLQTALQLVREDSSFSPLSLNESFSPRPSVQESCSPFRPAHPQPKVATTIANNLFVDNNPQATASSIINLLNSSSNPSQLTTSILSSIAINSDPEQQRLLLLELTQRIEEQKKQLELKKQVLCEFPMSSQNMGTLPLTSESFQEQSSFYRSSIPGLNVPPSSVPLTNLAPSSFSAATLAPSSSPATNMAQSSVPVANFSRSSVPLTNLAPSSFSAATLAPSSNPATNMAQSSVPVTNFLRSSVPDTSSTPSSVFAANFAPSSVFATNFAPSYVSATNLATATSTVTATNVPRFCPSNQPADDTDLEDEADFYAPSRTPPSATGVVRLPQNLQSLIEGVKQSQPDLNMNQPISVIGGASQGYQTTQSYYPRGYSTTDSGDSYYQSGYSTERNYRNSERSRHSDSYRRYNDDKYRDKYRHDDRYRSNNRYSNSSRNYRDRSPRH